MSRSIPAVLVLFSVLYASETVIGELSRPTPDLFCGD
jgi:hypothetical protein